MRTFSIFALFALSLIISCDDFNIESKYNSPEKKDNNTEDKGNGTNNPETKNEYVFIYKNHTVKEASFYQNGAAKPNAPQKEKLVNKIRSTNDLPIEQIIVKPKENTATLKIIKGEYIVNLKVPVRNDSIFSNNELIGKIDMKNERIIVPRFYLSFQKNDAKKDTYFSEDLSNWGEMNIDKALQLSPFKKITDIVGKDYLFFSNVDYQYVLKK